MAEGKEDFVSAAGNVSAGQDSLRTFKRRARPAETKIPPISSSAALPVGISPAPVAAVEPAPKRIKSNPPTKVQKQLVQVHLDLGQKNFHSTCCPTCGLVYTPGKEADDKLHAQYHNRHTIAPKYIAGRGDTTVAADGTTGDIVRLNTASPTKALKDLVTVLETELGLLPEWLLVANGTAFLYVCRKTRNILGCLMAENITEAYTASSSAQEDDHGRGDSSTSDGGATTRGKKSRGIVLMDKENPRKVRHGIRMMWTAASARRKNIATKLLDCARCQLVRGYVIPRADLAFSQPTSNGAAFIQAYCGAHSFLVYDAKGVNI